MKKEREIRNILISGGWGYGNIGDDALLEATSHLVRKIFPKASIVWTSYDVAFTREASVLPKDATILPSVHRMMVGKLAFWEFSTIGKCLNREKFPYCFRRVYEKWIRPFLLYTFSKIEKYRVNKRLQEELTNAFRYADLFIMSGGGYFNSWETMFSARLKELQLAHSFGCKVVLLGQSIGPFRDEQKKRLLQEIREDDSIFVRDEDSLNELNALGIPASLIPDLALSLSESICSISNEVICVIPAELQSSQVMELAFALSFLPKGREVIIMVTRFIYPDVATAKALTSKLLSCAPHLSVRFVLPANYLEMKRVVSNCKWVVSRGMHGMILGWCAGNNIFALTTSRKINGLLRTVQAEGAQCSEANWGKGLVMAMLTSVQTCAEKRAKVRKQLFDTVVSALKGA